MSKVNFEMEWMDAFKLKILLSVKLDEEIVTITATHNAGFPLPSSMTDEINNIRRILETVEAAIHNAENVPQPTEAAAEHGN